jgi:hypothetical protein
MFARSTIAILLFCSVAAPAFSQAAPARRSIATAATPAPDDRARQWLVLVDDKNYAQSWTESAKAFQARQKVDGWANDAGAKRAPLGAVASRGLKSIDLSRNNICVIRYDTVFARKAAAVETVTLAFENGGWAVTDYSVE